MACKYKNSVILKDKREKSISRRHPWIFSGAIHDSSDFEDGEILTVRSFSGEVLGQAYFNTRCSLAGRMLSFGMEDALDAVRRNLRSAAEIRRRLVHSSETNCYRLVNSEGDFIPGLVVDVYDRTLALQVSTLGIEKLKDFIVDELKSLTECVGIYEKSRIQSRREEGLGDVEGWIYQVSPSVASEIPVVEHGIHYLVDLLKGQKTGLFLDHREMRRLVRDVSRGRRVLNCFGYTGGFSLNAERGGASEVFTVDSSEPALLQAHKNYLLNTIEPKPGSLVCEDVFDYLDHERSKFDLIILDPPAFVKRRDAVDAAVRAYQRINLKALEMLNPGGLLLSCSCSHYLTTDLFKAMLFKVACQSSRSLRVLSWHVHALDHPVNVCHPEGEYLKSALLSVD